MFSRILMVVAALLMVFSMAACKDKGRDKIPSSGPHGSQQRPPIIVPPGEPTVVVPDSIKGQWTAVMLNIENKQKKETKSVSVKTNSEYSIPDTTLIVKVGDFLPNFKMEGSVITSATETTENPAVRITIMDGEKEIFKGWLYSKFPAIHPFQHEVIGLTLKEGVKKG